MNITTRDSDTNEAIFAGLSGYTGNLSLKDGDIEDVELDAVETGVLWFALNLGNGPRLGVEIDRIDLITIH